MVIQIDTDLLIANGLSPDEYIMLYLVHLGRAAILHTLDITPDLEHCEAYGWCKYGEDKDIIDYSALAVRQKFIDLVESDEDRLAGAIMSRYPLSENRNGQRVGLQKDKKAIKAKIHKIVGKNKLLGDTIVKCIELELENRARAGAKAAYLPDLEVYLNQERWKLWEDAIEESKQVKEEGYGAKLI